MKRLGRNRFAAEEVHNYSTLYTGSWELKVVGADRRNGKEAEVGRIYGDNEGWFEKGWR